MAPVSGLAAAAFHALPLPAAIFRLGTNAGLEYEEGNAELWDAIGGDPSVYFADEAKGGSHVCDVAHDSLVSLEPRTIILAVDSLVRTFRLCSRPFTGTDGLEYAIVQFLPLTGQESRENELRSTIQQLQDLVDNSTALM